MSLAFKSSRGDKALQGACQLEAVRLLYGGMLQQAESWLPERLAT